MAEEPESLIAAKFRQGWPIDRAIKKAVQEALLMHQRLAPLDGNPVHAVAGVPARAPRCGRED